MTSSVEVNQDKVLHVGIDLGTSRSAIASSNGIREWVESYVGWPKDFIAEKVVGSKVLVGSEAFRHRLALDIHKPLERGVIKEGIGGSERAVKEIIRYLIELARTEPEQKIYAVVGVPADSLKVNKLAIRKAVAEYVHSLMVVSEPFAIAYGVDLLDEALIIDIGAGTVDFCIMHGTIPYEEDQRTIFSAGDYIDDQLFSAFAEKYPKAKINKDLARSVKEKHSIVGHSGGPIKVEFLEDSRSVTYDVQDEVRRACESIFPAIVETIIEMVARMDPEFQAKVKNNVLLGGGGSQIRGIEEYLQKALKDYGQYRVTRVEDPLLAGATGGLKLARDMPANYWETL
jgi:rod shape-determining protein MreB and related proteins